jgi:hypothetical protein
MGGDNMHRLWRLNRYALPALALAAALGHTKWGVLPYGFSRGN